MSWHTTPPLVASALLGAVPLTPHPTSRRKLKQPHYSAPAFQSVDAPGALHRQLELAAAGSESYTSSSEEFELVLSCRVQVLG